MDDEIKEPETESVPIEEDNQDPKELVKQKDNEIIDEILQETDIDKLKDLTHVFNAFQTKREVLRVNALNDVQDALVEQMSKRLKEQPHNFSNSDISSWMKVVQQTLDSSKQAVTNIDSVPAVTYQQNNTQININTERPVLNRDSRERVAEVLKKILAASEAPQEAEIIEDNSTISEDNKKDGE